MLVFVGRCGADALLIALQVVMKVVGVLVAGDEKARLRSAGWTSS